MSLPLTVVLVIQVVSALAIIVLVLLQQGKGADMGSAFGTGSAGSLFGASGAANFLSRATKWAAVVFFVSTASLAWIGHHGNGSSAAPDTGVMQNFQQPQDRSVPQAPGAKPAPAAPATGGASVPTAPATPAQPAAPAAKPDASVPAAPAPAPAGKTPAAPAK